MRYRNRKLIFLALLIALAFKPVQSDRLTGVFASAVRSMAPVAMAAEQDACSFSISPASQSFSADGGAGSVSVTTLSNCSWTGVSNDDWITVTSGRAGTGSGTVNYSVAGASIGECARAGSITVAGQTFIVRQATGPQECPNTPAGSNVNVQLGGVTINFNRVVAPGISTFQPGDPCIFQPGDPCRDLPPGFSNYGNRAFDIHTTATVNGPIMLSFDLIKLYPPDPVIPVDPITPALVSTLRVFHVENGVLIDRTFPIDPITPPDPIRVANVDSLSHFVIARQPPRAALQSALTDLHTLRQTFTSRNDALRLNVAIHGLTLALNPHLWRDPTHLQPLTGVVVYAALKGVIVPLHAALDDPRSSIPAATSRFYIDRILDAGRRLALIAISDARAAGGDQQAINRANQEISDGDAAAAHNEFEDAIVDYALAWLNARLALRGA